jgi:hypothetical protein
MRARAGTEVLLTLPAAVAYRAHNHASFAFFGRARRVHEGRDETIRILTAGGHALSPPAALRDWLFSPLL